jgi:hypothetical protein
MKENIRFCLRQGVNMDTGENKPLFPPESPPDNGASIKAGGDNSETGSKPGRVLMGLLPGIILILLGVVFLLSKNGYQEGEWWQYFLVGLGVAFLVESRLQYKAAAPRRTKISRLITGLLMVLGGILFLFNPNQWWPLGLIGAGILLCVWYLWRRSHREMPKAP